MLQPGDPTPSEPWTAEQIAAAGQRLREAAFATPFDHDAVAERVAQETRRGGTPVPPEIHRELFWYAGHDIQLQVSLDVGLQGRARMLHVSCGSRMAGGALPESIVQMLLTAVYLPGERWVEAQPLRAPGRIRQFLLFLPPAPLPAPENGSEKI